MNLSNWFTTHLHTSADGLLWAVEQVPVERLYTTPPGPEGQLGEWNIAQHLFHMVYYEQQAVIPGMTVWVDGTPQSFDGYDEEKAWATAPDIDALRQQFRDVRAAQLALIRKLDATAWDTSRETGWGNVTLTWLVSKTYQHTAEHTSDILRIALFWDGIAEWVARQRAAEAIQHEQIAAD